MKSTITKYKHIKFEEWEDFSGRGYCRCTNKKSGSLLGTVEWGDFNCYEFVPQSDTGFTIDCLLDIVDFIRNIKK